MTARAEFSMASPLTDHAVLQRDLPVPIWGMADAGSKVTVKFSGQEKTTVADAGGKWKVMLEPMAASFEPRSLTVAASNQPNIRLADLVIGEVWICSGQSNMAMGASAVPEVAKLTKDAEGIRCFTVKNTVAFTEQQRCEGQWETESPKSAVAAAFGCHLKQKTDAPIGIILTCWGSSSLEAWMPRDMTETVPHFKTVMEEFDADQETRGRIASILEGKSWSRTDDIFLRRQSNILYNAMMHPLAPYACRGLVWYQGERNTQSMFGMLKEPWYSRNSGMLKYGETLKQWVLRYRREWERDDLHFLVVMLPGYGKTLSGGPTGDTSDTAESPVAHSWAWMRESQLKVLDLPHTSVANTIDLGDVKNIHPKDKLPVGQRLALLAASDALGMGVPAHGPTLKSVKQVGDRLVVHFDHAEGLTTKDGESPKGFWLADKSARWVKANAELKGETVQLSSPKLVKPLYVRYAFAGKPKVNLVNKADLPAYPFRTDRFQP